MSEDLILKIRESFELPEVDAKQYSPLVLAYIGDNIYEMINRTVAVTRDNMQVNKLHKECAGRAKAETQAKMIHELLPLLTEEEENVYKRGRNAQSYTKAKNASTIDYRNATGLEALIGYLYLKGDFDRIVFMVKTGWDALQVNYYKREEKLRGF